MKRFLAPLIALGLIAIVAIAWGVVSMLRPAAVVQSEAVGAAGQGNVAERVVLDRLDNLPEWLLVAYQRDCEPGGRCPRGQVHFNQRTITRNGDGTADIWIQVRHGSPQRFAQSSETTETTIRYELERLHYRFNCTDGTFIVVERQIMGPNEAVVARDQPEAIYRAPVRGSATGIIQPIACRGS